MSLKELLSKPKAELVTLAKRFRLRGVFQLPKDALAKRIAMASSEGEKTRPITASRKRSRGVRSVSQRRSRLVEAIGKLKSSKPKTVAVAGKRNAIAAPSKPGRGASPAEPSRPVRPPAADEISRPELLVSHRFEIPEMDKQVFVAEDLGELPQSYGTGKLFLAARDPYWLFAYWDFTGNQMHDFRMQARNGTVYLRLCDVTDLRFNGHNAPVVQEIALDPNARDWYLHVGAAGRNYVAQLGLYGPHGDFRVVATSRTTQTPSDRVSGDTRARFVTIPMTIPFERLKELVRQYLQEGGELADVLAKLQEEGFPFPFPVPRNGRWTGEQQNQILNYMGAELLRRIQVGSFEISEWLRRRLLQEMGSAGISSLFSPFGASWSRRKGFWLNVNAEVILYGATEPDAKVTIDGEPIKLRPDGTFSFHCAFPDGEYLLPIRAESADKTDSRGISLQFKRRSRDRQGEVGEVPVFAPIPSPEEVTMVK